MEPFIGEIRIVGFTFAPRGWAMCEGQLLSISQNTALFSLLGTYYGGDGKTTFALPDLRGRVPVSAGQGPGLSDYPLGSLGGTPAVQLTRDQSAAHQHSLTADAFPVTTLDPIGNVLGTDNAMFMPSGNVLLDPRSMGLTGNDVPHNNRQPYVVINYVIALEGVFPKRP